MKEQILMCTMKIWCLTSRADEETESKNVYQEGIEVYLV